MTRTALLLTSAALLALVGCSREAAAPPTASDETRPVPTATVTETASATPTSSTSPSPGPSQAQTIPAAIQGRWGLVPADCTSTRGDAKGLLTISPTTLSFYESRGMIGAIKVRKETGLRAEFAFSGEGMTWKRDVGLIVQDDGKTLLRREDGDGATREQFRYTRCAA